jgi:uncharacterized Zn finger protein (UPF0148 family)
MSERVCENCGKPLSPKRSRFRCGNCSRMFDKESDRARARRKAATRKHYKLTGVVVRQQMAELLKPQPQVVPDDRKRRRHRRDKKRG